MRQRVGTCSICGGSVEGQRGAWMSTNPPPPDRCTSCGAVRTDDVIEMQRPTPRPHGSRRDDWRWYGRHFEG